MMDIFIVVALVPLFFLITSLFVVVFLSHHPYNEHVPTVAPGVAANHQSAAFGQGDSSAQSQKIAYSFLALLLLGLCMVATRNERKKRKLSI